MASERELDFVKRFIDERLRPPSSDDSEEVFRTLAYAGFTMTTILNRVMDAQTSDKTLDDILDEFELGLSQQLFYANNSEPKNPGKKLTCEVALNVIKEFKEFLEKEKDYG